MKRIKTTFNTYSKLGKPTQSLINFLMNNGNIHFLMTTDADNEDSLKDLYDDNETIESHEGNVYTVTFEPSETIEDNTEVVILGVLHHDGQYEPYYEFMGKYTITNNSFTVRVPEDKDDNYNAVDFSYVKTLPSVTHLTGAIRLDNVNEESGYDLTIPYCNLSNYSPSDLPAVTPSATNGRTNARFVAKTNNDLVVKVVYDEENSSSSDTYVKIQLFNSLDDETPFAETTNSIDAFSNSFNDLSYLHVTLTDSNDAYLNEYVIIEPKSQKVAWYESALFDVTSDDPIVIELKAITDTNNYLSYFNSFYGYDTPDSLTSDSSLQAFKLDKTYASGDYPLIVGKKIESISSPANIAIEPSSTNLNENIPYPIFSFNNLVYTDDSDVSMFYGKLKLAKNPNARIDYQLRSTSFTLKYISYRIDDSDSHYLYSKDVYYKIGVCPLDGTTKTRDSLVNDLKHYAFSAYMNTSSNGGVLNVEVKSPIWYENQYTFGELGRLGTTSLYFRDIENLMNGNESYCNEGLCNNAIIPILNSEATELLGFMYIQLCNTDGSVFDDVNLFANTINHIDVITNKTESEPINGNEIDEWSDGDSAVINYMGFRDHDIDGGFIPSISDKVTMVDDGD